MRKIICCLLLIVLCTNVVGIYANEISPNVKVSSWASEELDVAESYELIIETLGNDFTKNITRKEFCQLVINMVEKVTDKELPVAKNPFTDTSDVSILKAYKAGIVNGTSETTFSPDELVSRQELAVMLIRSIRVNEISLGKTMLKEPSESVTFSDESEIASWAALEIKLANDNGIMNGVGDNRVNPLGNATIEQSIILIVRAYEKQIEESTIAALSVEESLSEINRIDNILLSERYLRNMNDWSWDYLAFAGFYDQDDNLVAVEYNYKLPSGDINTVTNYYLDGVVYLAIKDEDTYPVDNPWLINEKAPKLKLFVFEDNIMQLSNGQLSEYHDDMGYTNNISTFYTQMENLGKEIETLRGGLDDNSMSYLGMTFEKVIYLHGNDYRLQGYGGDVLLIYDDIGLTLGFDPYKAIQNHDTLEFTDIDSQAEVRNRY